jgi:hypothetical protein
LAPPHQPTTGQTPCRIPVFKVLRTRKAGKAYRGEHGQSPALGEQSIHIELFNDSSLIADTSLPPLALGEQIIRIDNSNNSSLIVDTPKSPLALGEQSIRIDLSDDLSLIADTSLPTPGDLDLPNDLSLISDTSIPLFVQLLDSDNSMIVDTTMHMDSMVVDTTMNMDSILDVVGLAVANK